MPVKYWETIADNLHKAGRSYGYVSAIDSEGRTIWIVDAHGYAERFIVHSHEKQTAFLNSNRRFALEANGLDGLASFFQTQHR